MTIVKALGAGSLRSPVQAPRPPNLLAQQITGRPYLSHSQIALMRSCPRKFAYQYVEDAPKSFLPASLVFGGAIHASLEHYFRSLLEGVTVPEEGLVTAYMASWHGQREQYGCDIPVRLNKTDSEASLHELAVRMIQAFLASPLAHPKGTILGVEETLQVVLDEDLPDLVAKVDLTTHTLGVLHVVDFKTSRSRWNESKLDELGGQLVLYGQSVSELSEDLLMSVKLHFAILTKAKKPIVQLLEVPSDPKRVESLKEGVASVWAAIQTGNWYPNPSPQNCTTCPYRDRCPAFPGR